ncbi:PIN domain-containing protein [Nautilia sp.]
MVLIDSNYILRFLTMTPKEHFVIAKNLFEDVAKGKIDAIISEGVVMEVYFVLSKFYKWEKEKIIDKLTAILEFKNVVNEDKAVLIYALNILKKHNIDFIDAFLCAKANFYGYEVRTFDKDIKKCL